MDKCGVSRIDDEIIEWEIDYMADPLLRNITPFWNYIRSREREPECARIGTDGIAVS